MLLVTKYTVLFIQVFMTINSDFYDSDEAKQLTQAYQEKLFKNNKNDWLFLVCLFFALNI